MFDYLLTDEQREIRDEVRDFVKSVPRQLILDMDADKVQFPKEFLQEAGRTRDLELDAAEAGAADEKVYE